MKTRPGFHAIFGALRLQLVNALAPGGVENIDRLAELEVQLGTLGLTEEEKVAAIDATARLAAAGGVRLADVFFKIAASGAITAADVQVLATRGVRIGWGPATQADEHHTMDELYEYRMLYNAHAARGWLAAGISVVKSWKHSDGEECFGGGWFIVVATLPTGQVSNHYAAEHWDLFDVPEVDRPLTYDGHTPADAAARLRAALVREGS